MAKVAEEAEKSFSEMKNCDDKPKEKLRTFLLHMCSLGIGFKKYLQPMVPYVLLKREFSEAEKILPLVRECSENKRSESECRIIAYEIIAFLQLIFYREEDFKNFTGVDYMDNQQMTRVVDMQLEMIFKN